MKKLILFVVGVCLLLFVGVVQAKEDYNFRWQKVGDSYFDVCNFNRIYFIENVENYNKVKMRNVPGEVKAQMDWKILKGTFGFKRSTVKQWDKGNLIDVYNKLDYICLNYNNKNLYLKYFLDLSNIFLFREEATETPYIQPSKNGNSFIFWDNEEIWTINPPSIEESSFVLRKITSDTINGKTKEQMQQMFGESYIVSWAFEPLINNDGSYVAYISNKDSCSRESKGVSEIWIIDLQKDIEKMVLWDENVNVYGWVDRTSMVCSLKDQAYIYNIETEKLTTLPQNIVILHMAENTLVYADKGNLSQVYLYDVKTNIVKSFPKLPENIFLLVKAPVEFYSLSPDGDKFLMLLQVMDSKNGSKIPSLIMLDLKNNSLNYVSYQAASEKREELCGLGKWISNQEIVVYSLYYENKMEMYRTWVLTINNGDKK